MATTILAGNATNGLALTPDNTGILEIKTGTGAGTTALTLNASQNATVAGTLQVAGVATNMYPIVSGTAVTASGTSVDFTGVPSWVKRITINITNVSTNGTAPPQIQIGDSGGIEITGYLGSNSAVLSSVVTVLFTSGFGIGVNTANWAAAVTVHGSIILSLLDATTNTWCATGSLSRSDAATTYLTSGAKSLSTTLDRLRLYIDGTQTFDAGTINILYE